MIPFICILYKAKLKGWKRVVSKALGAGGRPKAGRRELCEIIELLYILIVTVVTIKTHGTIH